MGRKKKNAGVEEEEDDTLLDDTTEEPDDEELVEDVPAPEEDEEEEAPAPASKKAAKQYNDPDPTAVQKFNPKNDKGDVEVRLLKSISSRTRVGSFIWNEHVGSEAEEGEVYRVPFAVAAFLTEQGQAIAYDARIRPAKKAKLRHVDNRVEGE